jgi:Signal transduction histidine kinase regulating citrate/malate metabolism
MQLVIGIMIKTSLVLMIVPIFKTYISTFLNKSNKSINVIGEVFVWMMYIIWQLINVKGSMNLAVATTLVTMVSIVRYQGKLGTKILMSFTFCAVGAITEILCGLLLIDHEGDMIWGIVLSKILFLTIVLFVKLFFEKEVKENLQIKQVAFLVLIPFFSFFISHWMFILATKKTSGAAMLNYAVLSSIFLILINLGVYDYYIQLTKELRERQNNAIALQQLKMLEEYQAEREKANRELRGIKHNYENDMFAIKSYIEMKEYSQAVELVDRLTDSINQVGVGIAQSGNAFVDAIINEKYIKTKSLMIDFAIDLMIPSDLPHRGSDLSMLIGNLLDNAFEAVKKLPAGDRFVELTMKYEKKLLLIVVTNFYDGIIKLDKKGSIISTKDEEQNHGYGLSSLNSVIQKYQGDMKAQIKNDVFEMKVVLYKPTEKLRE